jgi:hypothetical protein
VRVTHAAHNTDTVAHDIACRTTIDILINANDGALFASPTTHPGKILNGQVLEGKAFPEFLHVLERPDLNNPGMVAVMTFKHHRGINPNKMVLTQLGALGLAGGWEIPAQPAGDSACAIYWPDKKLQPGEKCEFVWGYGGGLASDPENDGKVTLGLGGSFEPHKLFTITATIDDPAPSQTLTLDLPAGLELVEGREIQPVPPPANDGSSMVLWKARVQRLGDYHIRVHSSAGTISSKHVSVQAGE